jgi:hypothetical protein
MALPIATIDNILNNGGDIKFLRTTTSAGKSFGEKGDVAMRFWPSYWNCTATVNLTDITLRETAEGDPNINAVNVEYEADWAHSGSLNPPGYVYTDSMSGCCFYLFRGLMRDVHGVHASRQSGKLIDPTMYFTQRGAKLVYKWDSQGLLTGAMQGSFGAVLCCVDQADLTAYAVALKGQKVVKVFERKVIADWMRAEL